MSVTQFGVYDSGGDGLAQTNTVGLWDESGTLLGFAGFPPGTAAPLVGEFRYAFLGSGPLLLNANTSYVLGAYSPGLGEIRIQGVPPPTFSSDATLIGTRRNNQIQFSFPRLESGTFPGQAVVGPNMQYTVVPEPCGASLLAFTAIGFLTKGRAAIRPSVRLASK